MRRILKKTLALMLILMLNPLIVTAFEISHNPSRTVVKAGVSDYRLSAVNIDWWDNFSDPYLKEYIFKTVQCNYDLKAASLKTKEYCQFVKNTRAAELPSVNLAGAYARLKTPSFDLNGLNFDSSGSNIFSVPLFVSYEGDIFLKNHDKTKSAKKQYEAAKYEEKATYISLVTSVATTYFNIINLDKVISLQEEIVKIRKEIFELTTERNKAGLASTYDVSSSDKLHTAAMIALNDLKKDRQVYLHQLAVLIGESPVNSGCIQRSDFDDVDYKGHIPNCISSQVVVQRPDMMKAEADLERAKIDIRVARKEFLPTLPILGAVGYTSLDLSKLFNWKSTFGLIGVGLVQNLFAGGRKFANLNTKKIQYEELFNAYKQADLQAIQEINDSLCKIKFDTQKDKDNQRKYDLEAQNFQLIKYRYEEGIISYLEMIQYKENLLSLERDKCMSKTQRLIDYLSLYKAVGTDL